MAEIFYNGRRVDGRRPNELRSVNFSFSRGNSDGIVLLHQGNTQAMASVVGPRPCRSKGDVKQDQVVLACHYTKPPFASTSGDRRKLTAKDRATSEYAAAIEEIFSCVLRKDAYPMSQIDIFVEILQSDGGEFACAINAVSLALTEAGIEMYNLVCAASVGLWGSHVFADLSRFEETPRLAQLTVACPLVVDDNDVDSPPLLLHTRLSSAWLPSGKLDILCQTAIKVAQTVGRQLAQTLRVRVR